jgi:hypothetical protein
MSLLAGKVIGFLDSSAMGTLVFPGVLSDLRKLGAITWSRSCAGDVDPATFALADVIVLDVGGLGHRDNVDRISRGRSFVFVGCGLLNGNPATDRRLAANVLVAAILGAFS